MSENAILIACHVHMKIFLGNKNMFFVMKCEKRVIVRGMKPLVSVNIVEKFSKNNLLMHVCECTHLKKF